MATPILATTFRSTTVKSDGSVFTLTNIMSFECRKEETQDITHMRLNGTTLVADLPKTFSGTIELQRGKC